MMDITQNRWVILTTPQKRLLARISHLQATGKMKIEECKISYRKKFSGWNFQNLSLPSSKTFSFHDHQVIQKVGDHYVSLRTFGLGRWLWLAFLSVIGASAYFAAIRFQPMAEQPTPPPAQIQKASIETPIENKTDESHSPKNHEIFLMAKRQFQFGKIVQSFQLLRKNLDGFNHEDRVEADSMLSEIYFLQCQEWAKQGEDRRAVLSCEKSISFSNNDKAEKFLNDEDQKARAFYLEGYTVQKFNPSAAKKKYALALQCARNQSTWRNKAQYQLRKLNLKG